MYSLYREINHNVGTLISSKDYPRYGTEVRMTAKIDLRSNLRSNPSTEVGTEVVGNTTGFTLLPPWAGFALWYLLYASLFPAGAN